MINLLHLLLMAGAIIAARLPLRVVPRAAGHVLAERLAAAGVTAMTATQPLSIGVQAALPVDVADGSAGAAAEGSTQGPIGRFLRSVRTAIPWVVGTLLVGALAVVVATCWLRKGVLMQNLSTGRGRTGAGKRPVNRKAAAEYLAQVEKRQAAKRDAEGGVGSAPKGP